MRKIIWFGIFVQALISCKSSIISMKTFKNSEIFKQNFTGFSLYNLTEKKVTFHQNSDKYFQPASNTKLLTFYAGLKVLGDSVPALKYITKGDSLIFWGTGDPSLFHHDLPKSNVIDFLKNRPEKLYFSNSNEASNRFGSGWMLEDYNEYYQAEINSFPIYGNVVRFTKNGANLDQNPSVFCTNIDSEHNNNTNEIIRRRTENCATFPRINILNEKFTQDVPFITSSDFTIKTLTEILKKPIILTDLPIPKNPKIIFSIKTDSLYKRMLLVSDNMIAEQIMLLVSNSDSLNTSKSIDYITKTCLSDLPDKLRWVDGSGLSRYNLVTPRALVFVLNKIYEEFPKDRIFNLMPSNTNGIYAKSGSYSNNYNLSGYMIGKSGKMYAFSFMNNNFMKPMASIRKEVNYILSKMQEKL